MPYGRYSRYARPYSGRRRNGRRKSNRYSTRTVKMTVPRVRRIIQNFAEKKFVDGTLTDTTIAGSWQFFQTFIASISQGTSANTRLGNKIMIERMTFNILITSNEVPANQNGWLARVVLFEDSACNGRVLTFDDLFATDTMNSVRASPYTPAVKILRDKVAGGEVSALDSTDLAWMSRPNFIRMVVRPRKVVDYVGATGGISDLIKYNWGLAYSSSSNSNACYINVTYKIEFTDV